MKKYIHIKSIKTKTSGFKYCFSIENNLRALGEMLSSQGVISDFLCFPNTKSYWEFVLRKTKSNKIVNLLFLPDTLRMLL